MILRDPTSGEWYDFDDSSVSKLRGKEEVVSDSAYILFYQRREWGERVIQDVVFVILHVAL